MSGGNVASAEKAMARILGGRSDHNVAFGELCALPRTLGCAERHKGDHQIVTRQGIAEIINLQALRDGKAKPYQMRQARDILNTYGLAQIPLRIAHVATAEYTYQLLLRWSEPDDAWIVDSPELPGAMADGATPAEAVANAEIVTEEWIEVAREDGRPIPVPHSLTPTT
jgi:predicted RNase H-like HicB family nuclease